MKIAYATHSYRPYVGGVEFVVEQMARGMAKKGHDVEVLTLAPPFSSLPKVERLDGYSIRRFSSLSPSNAYYVPAPAFVKTLTRLQADIVHVHVVHSLVPLAALIAKKHNPRWGRFLITPHFHDRGFSWHTSVAWLFYRSILKRILSEADLVHSISSYEAQLLKSRFGASSVIVPHGVSEDVLSYKWKAPKELTLTYSGRLLSYKRVDLLIQALARLSRFVPDVNSIIIGKGPEESSLKRLAKKLGVKVSFFPLLPRNEYLNSLARSSVLVYLSESEAFCITVLEALSIGVPCVLVEPWGKIFQGQPKTIILSQDCTSEDICNEILCINSRRHSVRMPANAVTWDKVCEKILKSLYTAPIN